MVDNRWWRATLVVVLQERFLDIIKHTGLGDPEVR
jgi:hypothetical protein